MKRTELATKLVHIAKNINAQPDDDDLMSVDVEKFQRINPKLMQLARYISKYTGGNLREMATAMVMGARMAGNTAEANRLFTIFRPLLPVIERRLGIAAEKQKREIDQK